MIKPNINERKRLNLKRLMEEKEISASQLAEKMGRKASQISAWTSEPDKKVHRNIGRKTLTQLCEIFSVPEDEFYKEIGKDSLREHECTVMCSEEMQRICEKVKKIIESPTTYAGSLRSNIDSFYEDNQTTFALTRFGGFFVAHLLIFLITIS